MSNRESQALVTQAVDHGVNLIDTADIYGQGDSERIIGRALRKRRDAALVVTKVGQLFSPRMRTLAPLKPLIRPAVSRSDFLRARFSAQRTAGMETNFTARYLASAIDRSLQRLQMSYVDCILLHSPAASNLTAEAIDALVRARAAGKVRLVGVACDDAATIDCALSYRELTVFELPPPLVRDRMHALEQAASSRPIHILMREVIRHRGDASSMQAVQQALETSMVRSVIVRTTSGLHLRELAHAAAATRLHRGQQHCEESVVRAARSDERSAVLAFRREALDNANAAKR